MGCLAGEHPPISSEQLPPSGHRCCGRRPLHPRLACPLHPGWVLDAAAAACISERRPLPQLQRRRTGQKFEELIHCRAAWCWGRCHAQHLRATGQHELQAHLLQQAWLPPRCLPPLQCSSCLSPPRCWCQPNPGLVGGTLWGEGRGAWIPSQGMLGCLVPFQCRGTLRSR